MAPLLATSASRSTISVVAVEEQSSGEFASADPETRA
jgi:hypothetical protein